MRNLLEPELTRDEQELFHHLYQHAARYLTQKGQLPPLAHFRAGLSPDVPGMNTGDIATVAIDMPGSDAGKDCVAAMLRKVARKMDADLIILQLESWMVKPSPQEAEHYQKHHEFTVRPSQHPDRIEIILLSVSKPGGQQWSTWVEIQRDAQGNPSIPADPPPLEHLTSEGRFGNLFDEDGYRPSKS
jgi:hypothetical protein